MSQFRYVLDQTNIFAYTEIRERKQCFPGQVQKVRVTKEKYSRVCGTKVELEVEITDGSTGVTWLRDGKTLKTSSPTKYVPATSSKPSLEINDLDKNDIGTYVCKVVYQTDNGMEEEIKSLPIVVNVIEVKVTKEKYSRVCGTKVELEVEITDGNTGVTWFRDGKTLKTSSPTKYALVTSSKPSLEINDLDKTDIGTYVCKVVYQTDNGMEEEIKSLPIVVNVIEVKVTKEKYSRVCGTKVELEVEIPDGGTCITWFRDGKTLKTSSPTKYALVTSSKPSLEINDLDKTDIGTYVCKVVYQTDNGMEEEIKSLPIVVNVIEVEVTKEKYSRVCGTKVELEVEITDGSTCITWLRDGKTLKTSSPTKYALVTSSKPSLEINDLDKNDIGTYMCKVVYQTDKGKEEEIKSRPIVVNVIEVKVTKEKYSRVCGTKVELEVEIPDGGTCITWFRDGKTLKTSSPTKYALVTSSKPSLEINDLDKTDIGTYVCKVVYQTDNGMEEEIKSLPIVVNVIEVEVTKEKYSRVCGTKVELEVEITDGSTGVTWFRDGKTLKTSSPTKYALVTSSKPSLEINDLDKNDIGTYMCKVVFQTDKGMEEEIKSRPIVVNVIEVKVAKEKYSRVCGTKVELEVEIPDGGTCITWFRDGKTLKTSSSTKYALVTSSKPSLEINDLDKNDIGTYVCKGVYQTDNGMEEEIKSRPIVVKVIEVKVTKEKYSRVCGTKVELEVEIPDGGTGITWFRDGETLKTSSSTKYALVTSSKPSLEINDLDKNDIGTYVCKVVYQTDTGKKEEIKSLPIVVKVIEVKVTKEKYSRVCGTKVELEVEIPDGGTGITWFRDGETLKTSSSTKYALVTSSKPSLEINDLDKNDIGTYVCKVVYQTDKGMEEEIKSRPIVVNVIEVVVSKEKYSQVYGSALEIEVHIPDGSKRVTWYLNKNFVDTSSSKKYAPVNVSNPSLNVYGLGKADIGSYVCKVVFVAENGNKTEEEIVSPPIEVELKEPVFLIKNVKVDFGDEASIHCKISNCPEEYEIYWEKEKGKEFQSIDTAEKKYCLSTKENPHLTIKNIYREDAATHYRCCMKSGFSEMEYVFKSNPVKLCVSNVRSWMRHSVGGCKVLREFQTSLQASIPSSWGILV
ncbi:obscurin-like [Mytilus edulis]|uniref:obscurin-like n=1 Tax=Mytilus edulis TaxID=6550 RepID=UPI0039EE454E